MVEEETKDAVSVIKDEEEDRNEDLSEAHAIYEHEFCVDRLQDHFETNLVDGLSESEAKLRLERDGENALTPPPKPYWLWKALGHVLGGFSLLLWAGAVLCFIVYGLNSSIDNLVLGIVLAAVVLGTGVFSYYQEKKSVGQIDAVTTSSCLSTFHLHFHFHVHF